MHVGARRLRGSIPLLLLVVTLPPASRSLADELWEAQGIPVYAPSGDQLQPAILSDGVGGFISAWEDGRSSTSHDVYAQRLDADGNPLWGQDGVAVCTANFMQTDVRIVSDGADGAIVSWQDMRSPGAGIYVQHLTSAGLATWNVNGVRAAPLTCLANYYNAVSDGNGGVLLTWQKCTDFTGFDIGAQRVNSLGTPRWGANGLAVCNAGFDETSPGIAAMDDGSGDCVVAWADNRSGISGDWNIYAQRVTAAGSMIWTNNGVPVGFNVLANEEWPVQVQGDGADGAIVAWEDLGIGTHKIWAQRLNAAGEGQWLANGIRVCDALGHQYYPTTASDGAGGVLFAWYDQRDDNAGDLYAQRLSNAGTLLWDSLGVALCASPKQQFLPSVFRDAQDGFVAVWQDERADSANDIYAQRLLVSTGAPQWQANGVALGAAPLMQVFPAAASDGQGGVLAVWQDYRSGTNYDVYATRAPSAPVAVGPVARTGSPLRAIPSILDPRAGAAASIVASGVGAAGADVRIIDAGGRAVRAEHVNVASTGDVQWRWDGRGSAGTAVPAGVYTVALSAGRDERRTTVIVIR